MEEAGRGNILDPGAAEFYPAVPAAAAAQAQYALGHPQIYYTYPPGAAHQPPPPPPQVVALPVFHLPQPAQMEAAGTTRAVALSMVPRHVGEAEVRAAMEAFGRVRAVEMGALAAEGVVTVRFFDFRSAEAAVAEVREQHARLTNAGFGFGATLSGNWAAPWSWRSPELVRGTVAGHPVWAQFAADDPHQGCLVLLNSDPTVSLLSLREIFEPFGPVKEVREMPSKPQHKLVEFFDTRDAARALSELNGKEINGRRLLLEFSRHGGRSSNNPRSSGHGHGLHNSHLPPRYLRGGGGGGGGGSQSSRSWAQTSSRSSSSAGQESAAASGAGGRPGGGSGGGRRNKSSSGSSTSCNQPSSSTPSSSKQQLSSSGGGGGGRRNWKSRNKISGESRFLFKEAAEPEDSSESSRRDSRTTVMIKNIPNKYSQKLLLNMLDNHCIQCNEQISEEGGGAAAAGGEQPYSAYDFVYLPIDFNNKCNVGYGFVNLTSPEAAFRLYKAFHLQPWEVFNSRKICQVTYARLQGVEALKEHFKNSKFACDNDEYMPVVFSPPRDGKQLTEPVPVVVSRPAAGAAAARGVTLAGTEEAEECGGASSNTTATSDKLDDDDDDDDDDDVDAGGGDSGSCGDATGVEALQLSCN